MLAAESARVSAAFDAGHRGGEGGGAETLELGAEVTQELADQVERQLAQVESETLEQRADVEHGGRAEAQVLARRCRGGRRRRVDADLHARLGEEPAGDREVADRRGDGGVRAARVDAGGEGGRVDAAGGDGRGKIVPG